MAEYKKLKVLSGAERAEKSRELVWPNPGDIIMSMLFGWALFCVFLVTTGTVWLRKLSSLARSRDVKEAFLNADETLLTILMVGGSMGIIALVVGIFTYRKLFIGAMIFGVTFANASWKPIHDVAFIIKYLGVVFLACFAALFLVKNFWRMTSTPYIRVVLLYFLWIVFICLVLGGRTDDIWYMGTDLALIIGFSIGWLNYIDDTNSLYEFNRILGWSALVITILCALAPFLTNTYIGGGRFQAYSNRSTRFGVTFSPCVLALFWMGMSEKRDILRNIFSAVAILGLVLILWSGTRSAMLGLILGVGILWWVFRTRIFIYIFGLMCLGLVAQILGASSTEQFTSLAGRLQDVGTDTGRFEIWKAYSGAYLASPIFGHSPTGVDSYFFSGKTIELFDKYGLYAKYSAPHNAYLGMAVRYGAIGLVLLLSIIMLVLFRAKRILLSREVPVEDKHAFVLPFAIIMMCSFEVLFEDALSSSGKGTVIGFIFFPCLLVLHRVAATYEKKYFDIPESSGSAGFPSVSIRSRPGGAST